MCRFDLCADTIVSLCLYSSSSLSFSLTFSHTHTPTAQPPPSESPPLSPIIVGVVFTMVVLVIGVVAAIGILGKRKLRAKIWRPHSPASESDNASTSHGTDGRRRSSQAGGAVTGTEPSALR